MPIEIRELVIRATVESTKDGVEKSTVTSAKGSGKSVNNDDQLVQACVEQVLEILRRKQER
jgi:Family of unknown function (DUF5908)